MHRELMHCAAQMAVKADYWDQAATLDACTAQLRTALVSPTISAADLSTLLTLLPDALLARVDAAWVGLASKAAGSVIRSDAASAAAATPALLRLFGSVRAVLITDSLRQQFCSLPFPVIKLWAGLDQLAVDSENTVAVLLTAWFRYQAGTATPPTDEQRRQLSALLRLSQLSPSFLQHLLEKLPWWRKPAGLKANFATALATALLAGAPRSAVLSAAQSRPRQPWKAEAGPGQLKWKLSLKQLQRVFGSGESLHSPRLYWAGWEWSCNTKWRSTAGAGAVVGKTLGFYCYVHTAAILKLPSNSVFATAVIACSMAIQTRSFTSVLNSDSSWGYSDMLDLAAPPTTAAAVAAALGPLLQEGHLELAMQVSAVR
jgi:hypothetical protein